VSVKRLLSLVALLLLVAADPARATVPDGGVSVSPVPEAPAAPPTLAAVIELLKKGDNAGALKGAREFVKAQPGNALGHEVHGFAAQANRLVREAETAYAETLRIEPGRVSVMVRLGHLALSTRDYKKAEAWFRSALSANADFASARRGLALVLMRQRQLPAAASELQEALRRSGGTDLEAKYLLAQLHYDSGRTAEAEAILDEVLAAAPDNLSALLLQGLVKLERGKPAEAEAVFEKVVQRDPKSPGARMGLAIVERSRGQLAKAVAEIEALAKERPEWAMAHFELGRTLLMQRQLEPAMRAFERAEQTSSDPAVARVRAAQVLAAAGERDRAMAKAQASIASTNAAPLAHSLLARLYLDKGSPDLAEREFQSAIKAAPRSTALRMQLARFYLAQRRPGDAVATLEEATKLAPTSVEPLGMLVDAYLAQGKADPAVATAERLRKLQGDTAAAYLIFGVVNEKVGRPEPALAAYQSALDREPHFLAAARARASLLERQQQPAAARRLLEETARGRPQAVEPLVDLAQLEDRAGNPEGAVDAFRRALARAPDNPGLMNNLAYLLARDPATAEEAVGLAEKALARAPDSGAIADTLGWALYQKGELGRAEEILSRVAKAAPQVVEVRYHLGMVYAKQGKSEEARRELEAALKNPNFKGADEARRTLESLK
jgi:tetratricopeptide (TPR) repeat protein